MLKNYVKLQSRWRFLCLHSLASSFLVLRLAMLGLHMIKYFSLMHRLHLLLAVENDFAFAKIFHLIEYWIALSFNDHIC